MIAFLLFDIFFLSYWKTIKIFEFDSPAIFLCKPACQNHVPNSLNESKSLNESLQSSNPNSSVNSNLNQSSTMDDLKSSKSTPSKSGRLRDDANIVTKVD